METVRAWVRVVEMAVYLYMSCCPSHEQQNLKLLNNQHSHDGQPRRGSSNQRATRRDRAKSGRGCRVSRLVQVQAGEAFLG